MMGVINPVVYGGNQLTFLGVLIMHGLGLGVSALGTGALLGLLGSILLPTPLGWPVVSILAAWGALAELRLVPMPHPQSTRQVPHRWIHFSPWMMGLFFGLGLGPGVTTRIVTSAFYIVVLGAAATSTVVTGAAILGSYAAGRWLALILFTARPSYSQDKTRVDIMRVLAWRSALRIVIGLILASCAGIFISHFLISS